MKLKQKIMVTITTFLLGLNLFNPSFLAATTDLSVAANAAISVDAKTGQIIYQKNADQSLAIASISKLITTYMVVEQIKQHHLKWNDRIKISQGVADLSQEAELTNVPLKTGASYTVKELVEASLIASANAAAVALGNQVAGSPIKFAKAMNQTVQKMGIHDAKLYNAAGVTNEEMGTSLKLKSVGANAENMMSAKDVSLVAMKLIQADPQILNVTKQSKFNFAGTTYPGHNQLLGTDLKVDGLKTGTSDKSGGSFVGTANQNHHRIITVVLHASNQSSDDPGRFNETRKIMEYTYQHFNRYVIAAGQSVNAAKSVSVVDGKKDQVAVGLTQATALWMPKTVSRDKILGKIKLVTANDQLSAPLEKNQKVGTISFKSADYKINYLNNSLAQHTIKTTDSVAKQNVFIRIINHIIDWFKSF
ncbi:serine hydrolase [Lentilactobacillus laojiaonis]|uniref:serine hydrolase n=1 Tax=Lentilactobacillus laojiaonis TaxID=2883998 RepID=UPI001D09C11E|nr:serine hydrolase [Lentilactobacillus laojiaonis]UDM32027.1 D-alanyl-D-alanine carboxypeptidase [Lentilactobacillus laojiaonis]